MTAAQPDSSLLAVAFAESVEGVDDTEEYSVRILDAAFDLYCRQGIQRTSVEEVARHAEVSRITIYRRFATKDALVEHVVRREFRRYFDQFLDDIKQASTAEERVVVGFVSSLRTIRRNPLIGGLMSAEPDSLVPSMVGEDGRTLAQVRAFIAGQLRREQAAGNVSADLAVDLVAEMIVRVTTSFLVTPSRLVDLDDDAALAHVAREFLVPMLTPGRAQK